MPAKDETCGAQISMTSSVPAKTIYGLVDFHSRRNPDALALLGEGLPPLTYRRLSTQIEALGTRLNQLGIGRSDRVAVVLPNGPEIAVAFLGVAASATCAPLNPAYRADEFDFYLSDLNAKALLVSGGLDSPAVVSAQRRAIPVLKLSLDSEGDVGVFELEGQGRPAAVKAGLASSSDTALVLHTSGTTSRPKIVPLSHENLCCSAWNVRTTLGLSGSDRCLNVMPLFHIHGLVAALLASLAAGGSVVCTPGFYAPKFFEWMADYRPTWYTAVPTMHQSLLARTKENRATILQHSLRFIRSSSASLPPQVMTGLEEAFGVPVIEAYGMTEAAHQMASNPLPPGLRKPGTVGLAAGPEIGIINEVGDLLGRGDSGEIVIRGPNVTSGYENNPTANQSAFSHGWFRTGDQGFIDSEGYVSITGRLKELINRGGEKISPREVDEVLIDHPAIEQAVTFAVPHPQLGEDVGAALVLRRGFTANETDIRAFAAERLAYFKVPRWIRFLDEIPKGPTGKLQRIGLAKRLGVEAILEERPDYLAPVTLHERAVAEIWSEVLKQDGIGRNDSFLALGGDSILATRVVARIRDSFKVEISLLSFFNAQNLADLAQVVGQVQQSHSVSAENSEIGNSR
jgi:acyl-CoA synthetase (AMP-forming)/AMP-acid ligase II/acyl carrier protein